MSGSPATSWVRKPASLVAIALLAGLGLVLPSSVPAIAYQTGGLLVYYDFSNVSSTSSGDLIPDLSGSGRNGTIRGAGTLSFDSANKALSFPGGANGTMYIDIERGFETFSGGLTIEFEGHFGSVHQPWERIFDFAEGFEQTNNVLFVGHFADSKELAMVIWDSGAYPAGVCHTDTGATNPSSATKGTALGNPASPTFSKWLITVGTDGDSIVRCRIYKDGVALATRASWVGSNPDNFGSSASDGSTYILPPSVSRPSAFVARSNFVADSDFEGSIRYLRIYDRALEPAQVLQNATTSYVVTFEANGGSGSMTPQSSSSSAHLTANGFDYPGFRFAGWNTEEYGSGDSFVDGASYPFTSSDTLYAQWTVAPAGGGGSNSGSQPAAVTASSAQLAQTGPNTSTLILPVVAALLSTGVGAVLARQRSRARTEPEVLGAVL